MIHPVCQRSPAGGPYTVCEGRWFSDLEVPFWPVGVGVGRGVGVGVGGGVGAGVGVVVLVLVLVVVDRTSFFRQILSILSFI